ncbi:MULTISPECIES: ribosome recycling factor [Hymenobacter]|jgi:ribosome recycling factor|uniref:Ribosome-recycling factor n=1 Tax=Hymenobacter yonginensis TaxID=748197 RepID=A0ABY7PJS4_9BACT|nr:MULTISPECIES: ribosome recycling factor [Hymenobacter]AII52547.1 ribosome recycling factor [Hymenobacter sp. APR13]MBC6697062.1 ribosome recycling factor [Hymenobacter sp. BT190]WBO83533.1 ribosome recycling factor [Hymenobacter yonginensis]
MDEEIQFYLSEAEESMAKSLQHTGLELSRIRAGKASPAMLDSLRVDYYGTPTPISQVANVSTPDARTLFIKPWEKNIIAEVVKAIKNSDLGLNPQSDAEGVRLNIPPMTEERRRDLVKQVKQESESGKVRIRGIRKDVNESLRKLQKDGAAEDAIKDAEAKVQKATDSYIVQIDSLTSKKESEIMTI